MKELIEYIAKSLVDHPEDVQVRESGEGDGGGGWPAREGGAGCEARWGGGLAGGEVEGSGESAPGRREGERGDLPGGGGRAGCEDGYGERVGNI